MHRVEKVFALRVNAHPKLFAFLTQPLFQLIRALARARESTTELKERLRRAGEQLGVRIYAQREDLFNAMHRV